MEIRLLTSVLTSDSGMALQVTESTELLGLSAVLFVGIQFRVGSTSLARNCGCGFFASLVGVWEAMAKGLFLASR